MSNLEQLKERAKEDLGKVLLTELSKITVLTTDDADKLFEGQKKIDQGIDILIETTYTTARADVIAEMREGMEKMKIGQNVIINSVGRGKLDLANKNIGRNQAIHEALTLLDTLENKES